MADSVDRKYRGGATKEEIAKLKTLPTKAMSDRVEPSDLPNWAKTALVKRELYGLSWNEAAKEFNRTGNTLNQYGKSPIGKKIREEVAAFRDDPVEVAKAFLASNALGITLDRLAALEWAKDARDYASVDKIAADLQDRVGITKKQQKGDGAMTINLTLPGGMTLEPIRVQSESRLLEGEVTPDWEIEEQGE